MTRTPVLSKYLACLHIAFRAAFEYRINFVLTLAGAIAPVIIQTALWIALYAGEGESSLFGFTFTQMIAYTVIAQLVSRLVRTGFEYDVQYEIKTGSLDRYLVKPIGYFGYRLFSFIGDKIVQSAFMGFFLVCAVIFLTLFLGFSLTIQSVCIFFLALILAFLMNFLVFWCLSMCGFWLTDIGYLFEAVRIVIIALSGGILPLPVLGKTAERILYLLPFRFTIQFPTDILGSRIPKESIAPSFALALAWMAALVLISRLIWKKGLKRFAAVGS